MTQIKREKLLKVKEAAAFLDVSFWTLYRWTAQAEKDGEALKEIGKTPIPFRRAGRCLRFCKEELSEWTRLNGRA